jgi:dynein heavy chain
MGSTFSGLTQVGAWGCFDEFNRINIEVLSVVSAQIRAIQNALNYGRDTVDIGLGAEIKVNTKVGIFITMNPGYAGRTELPDNLKALFRPVTMIVPDLLQICEIMLFSEGFEGARVLAKKMTTLYKLAKEQLSKQYHYDFGLRALKSVLVMAGSLKREFATMPEDLVLMRSLRDSNMPKFVFEDVPLFRGLIADLFPGLDCPRVAYPQLKAAAEAELERLEMRHDDEACFQLQVDKVIQLYEIILTRHTTMIVGPTGGGKTVVLQTLQKASAPAFDKQIKTFTLNPKAQSVNELYGVMDPATRDWTDGVLSKLFRSCNESLPQGKENEVRWIVFDGDVDAVWVENMNSVMDDNKLLTLPNGERIRLQPYCKLIIEVFDLQYASPATISRCGVVYVDPKYLGYRPYYVRWVKQRCRDKATESGHMLDLFEKYIPRLLTYVLEGQEATGTKPDGEDGPEEIVEPPLEMVMPLSNLNMVQQLCSMLDAILLGGPMGATGPATAKEAKELGALPPVKGDSDGETSTEWDDYDQLEGMYIFALVWSLGAAVSGKDRLRFDNFLQNLAEKSTSKGLLYDSFFNHSTRRWQEWSTVVPDYVAPSPFEFHRILVPTTDSVLYTWTLQKLVSIERPVIFVGESGTAKTVTIQNYLHSLEADKYNVLNINFSSRTTARDVQANIEANVDKRSGKTFGPPIGKKLMVFIDDLNMPKVDTYGTQQPIALLHFLVGRGHMYDRGKDLDLRTYKDLLFLGAMGPPGGGRNAVDPRFIALFNVFNLTPPTQEVLTRIYGTILSGFIQPFNENVQSTASRITDMTLKLYAAVLDKLPPTPAKFHYVFTLRDLGRVYQGLCLATPDVVTTGLQILRLWRNETDRVFSDRLVKDADVAIVRGLMGEILKKNFSDIADGVLADPCVFGDYRNAVARIIEQKEDARLYKDLGTYADVRPIADAILEQYNLDNKPMTLVLFEQALEHLTRIHRILRLPRGHALLVGVGGSGKQSLTKLASFLAGYRIFEITLVRNYGESEFREDLKNLYKLAGAGPVVFMFSDAHVIEEGFLEYINNMLTTGVPPALYEADERDAIVNQIRAEVKINGIVDTKENCWNFFVSKCRNNMHIVLAMSPSGDTLRRRCRNFPGLVSSCTIDWFTPWPANALVRVAEFFLREETLPEENRNDIVSHMVKVHTGVLQASTRFEAELRRHNYVTPKNYLDYIATYRAQLTTQRNAIVSRTKRLEGGLTKLEEAQTAVDKLSGELREQKVVVDAKTVDVEVLIRNIGERQTIADKQQGEAQTKQKELEATSRVIEEESAKANVALESALPALEAAAESLERLNKDDITEIRAFNTPPPLVMMVGMCVLHLRPTGKEDETAGWKGAKAMMSDGNFLKALKGYDKDKITNKMIQKVLHYFKDKDFNVEKMMTVSKAGAGLLQWVVAIKDYYAVARDVDPLKKRVAEMEKQQATSQRELSTITTALGKLQTEISDLDARYKAASTELAELRERASTMERRLGAASKLISGLGSERQRWTTDVTNLNGQLTRVFGDCLLTAGFLSYLGPFTFEYRQNLLQGEWVPDIADRKVPHTTPFSIEDRLTDEAAIQKWVAEGLPADTHSVYNGILTTKSTRRFPLCIDPQLQAVSWIKAREGTQLRVATFLDGDFMQPLKLAIQYGRPFLFENVDESLDPMIDPVLEQATFMDGTQKMITLDDKAVPWDDGFRLFLTSKLANPHYSPEIMGKVQIINYGVTQQGLENQLLNVVVGHERPDLEKQFKELVEEMSANAGRLQDLEESLLKNLSQSQGNILDNEDLIATLESAKGKAVEIGLKLSQAQITKADINRARAAYQPAAKRGSILFFTMASLSNIMKMYEISLSSFLVVFKRSLSLAKKSPQLEGRLHNMVSSATRECYDYTCTGIFEKHKLLFSFQLTCMICAGETGELNRSELDFFLKGDMSLEPSTRVCPAHWLPEKGWKDLLALSKLGSTTAWAEILESFEADPQIWRAWFDLEQPEASDLPADFQDKINPFQRLLIIRCLRPDRVYNGVKRYVMTRMGEAFVQPPVLDYNRIHAQSSPNTPVVFVLSPGADPQSDIQALGATLGFTTPTKFKFLALGQGQASKAEEMLDQGIQKGHWVLLANCHLLLSWMKNLEKILQQLGGSSAGGSGKTITAHPDFRLWLTTDPTDRFPLGILQRSLKVVTEPPDGLKLNMRASYSRITDGVLESCPHPAFRPLVYALVFLHAVVLERRKYGKLGWNVPYDFNESDFNVSRRLLALYLTKAWETAGLTVEDSVTLDDPTGFLSTGRAPVPWGSLRYLVGDAMYGGRVSDSFDRRVLTTYLDEYMGDFLFDSFDASQRFHFSRAGFSYVLPAWGNLESYTKAVDELPLVNGPSVFGLDSNAEIQLGTEGSRRLWADCIDLQPRDQPAAPTAAEAADAKKAEAAASSSKDDFLVSLVRELSTRIPAVEDTAALRRKMTAVSGMITPTQVVLLQELERWNNLCTTMTTSLADLQRALAGEIGMSDALEDTASALSVGRLPNSWRALAPQTLKPLGSWMTYFAARYKQYTAWIAVATSSPTTELPVMWLSGLHIPESYLTALVQACCRRRGWPLDKSALVTQVTHFTNPDDIKAPPEDGCYVRGLYLEGAAWDIEKMKLRRQDPKVLVTELPVLQVTPIEAARVKGTGVFNTPVYVTQARRNAMGQGLVFEADLSTDDHPSHWVLQGVALCLNTDA